MIPSGDFSLYDHVLDTAWALGAVDRDAGYFALARGTATRKPLELTKWLDTNYHYLVPELDRRPPVRARRVALDRAAARGRGARDRDAPGRARAVQLPAAVQGREARRWRSSSPSTRSCCASWPRGGRDRGAARRAVPRARPHGPRARRVRRRVRPRSRRRSSICLATYFAPADPRVFALPRRRAPRRPRARARSSSRAALRDDRAGSRSACSTAATCGPPTSTWRSTGSTPRSRRSAPIASRSRRRARCCTSRTRPRARTSTRSGRGWRSRPRSWTSWAC